MTVRILRRLKAAEDAESIANHIAKDSLKAARRFLDTSLQRPAMECLRAQPDELGMLPHKPSHLTSFWDFDFETGF